MKDYQIQMLLLEFDRGNITWTHRTQAYLYAERASRTRYIIILGDKDTTMATETIRTLLNAIDDSLIEPAQLLTER